jgi:hypothetical protein
MTTFRHPWAATTTSPPTSSPAPPFLTPLTTCSTAQSSVTWPRSTDIIRTSLQPEPCQPRLPAYIPSRRRRRIETQSTRPRSPLIAARSHARSAPGAYDGHSQERDAHPHPRTHPTPLVVTHPHAVIDLAQGGPRDVCLQSSRTAAFGEEAPQEILEGNGEEETSTAIQSLIGYVTRSHNTLQTMYYEV